MNKSSILPYRYKMMISFVIMINIAMFIAGSIFSNQIETNLTEAKKNQLIAITYAIDYLIPQENFEQLLQLYSMQNALRPEKIKLLNYLIAKNLNAIKPFPNLACGIYSLELESILTYTPTEKFHQFVGTTIAQNHPIRKGAKELTSMVSDDNLLRGEVLFVARPLIRDDKTIGIIFAYEPMESVRKTFPQIRFELFQTLFTISFLTIFFLIYLAYEASLEIELVTKGIKEIATNFNKRIRGAKGDMVEIANHINKMAQEIQETFEEKELAMNAFRIVMDNVDSLIYITDPSTHELVFANNALINRLNLKGTNDQLCYKCLYGFDLPCVSCSAPLLFDKNENPIFVPLRKTLTIKQLKGEFLLTNRLIKWHDGRILHMQVATDISERKALALAEATTKAKSDFLARMSHEIRTPMNGVLGMVHLALMADPSKEQKEYLKKIQNSASLLLGIINDILDFSKVEAGKLHLEERTFNIHYMLENIRELIQPKIDEKHLQLKINCADSVPEYIVGDELRLSQIFLNLLSNATKFTSVGSVTLNISSKPGLQDDKIHLDCSVKDTGIGMDKPTMDHLFKPFSQADNSTTRRFGGTGLGLSICKALVEMMKGKITTTSVLGEGSEFIFFIELGKAKSHEVQQKQESPWDNIRYENSKFLLIEDNEINQEICKAILEELGASVDLASNGEEGLKAYLNNDYDVIFMDVRMPIMDGIEATIAIRNSEKDSAKNIPIIAMTANAMPEEREESLKAGMNAHLVKPLEIDKLKEALYFTISKDS